MSDAKYVAKAVKRAGFTIEAQAQISYLGVDLGGGRRLARAVRRRRLEKPALMHVKIARHAQASKTYK
eukprot:7772197-Pyramimonas_sp.AAC.1